MDTVESRPENGAVVITHDPTICRVVIEDMVRALRGGPQSRERSLAITKLQEASMWLNEALRLD